MRNLNSLIEQRNKLVHDAQELAQSADFTPEKREQVRRMTADLATLTQDIADLRALADAERDAVAATDAARETRGAAKGDEFRQFLRTGEYRGSANTAAGFGGSTILDETSFGAIVVKNVAEHAPLLNLVTLYRTKGANPLPITSIDDTGNAGVIVAEEGDRSNSANLVTTLYTLGGFNHTSKILPVSRELIEDGDVDIEAMVGAALGERVAKAITTSLVIGAGSTSGPQGFANASAIATTNSVSSNTSVSASELRSFVYQLPSQHRANAKWYMNDQTIAQIATLVDSNGQFIFQPALSAGDPDRLCGYEIVPCADMASPAATAVVAVFGDLKKAVSARMVKGMTVNIYRELYAASGQIGIEAFVRFDSDVVAPWALKRYRLKA